MDTGRIESEKAMRGSTSSKFLVVETKSISHSRAPSMDSLVSVVDSVIERGPTGRLIVRVAGCQNLRARFKMDEKKSARGFENTPIVYSKMAGVTSKEKIDQEHSRRAEMQRVQVIKALRAGVAVAGVTNVSGNTMKIASKFAKKVGKAVRGPRK